ncbi:MAG: radical SAM protein [Thermodesulfobacteriota bacterium]
MSGRQVGIYGFRFFPTIALKVTVKCHLSCPFCCEPSRDKPNHSAEEFCTIISRLASAGTHRLCVTGGEPLLYPDLGQLLSHAKKHDLQTVLLTADGRALLKHCDYLQFADVLRISIHGPDSIHDAIVGRRGALKEIEESISKIGYKTTTIAVTTVITPLTISHACHVAEWCCNNGISKYYLFGVMPSGMGHHFIRKYGRVSEEDFNDLVTKLGGDYSSRGLTIVPHPYTHNAECILVYGDGTVMIDPYHQAPPFQRRIGNILTDSPEEILTHIAEDRQSWEGCLERFSRSSIVPKYANGMSNNWMETDE